MTHYGIIGESMRIRNNRIPDRVISGVNHIGLWLNPEPHTGRFVCGGSLAGISSINGLVENPARFFDFCFYSGPVYIPIMFLIYIGHIASTIHFYS